MNDTITRDYNEASQDATQAPADRPRLFDRAVALILDCASLGTSRKVSTGAIDTGDTDPTMLRLSKSILTSKTLDKIRTLQGEVRRYVASRSTPSVMFRAGVYLLPLTLLEQTDAYLCDSAARLSDLVAQFLAEYDEIKRSAAERLGGLYNPADYPLPSSLASEFSISWAYVAVDAPQKLGEISAGIMAREQAKAAATWESALSEATAVLRAGFADLVSHMVERLTPGDDGKKRVFRDSMIGNVREFLQTFPSRNLGDDAELAALAAEAGALLEGIDPKSLRESETLRDSVAAGMATIKARLDAACVTAPTRRYSVEE